MQPTTGLPERDAWFVSHPDFVVVENSIVGGGGGGGGGAAAVAVNWPCLVCVCGCYDVGGGFDALESVEMTSWCFGS